MNKKNYNIETLRVISALFVIIIHVSAYIKEMSLDTFFNFHFYRNVTGIAVISFFAISGYFVSKHRSSIRVKNQLQKILKIYFFSSLLYIMFRSLIAFLNTLLFNTPLKAALLSIIKNINLINVLNGTFGSFHLWFLSSLLIVLSFYYFFLKKKFDFTTITIVTFFVISVTKLNIFDFSRMIIFGGGFPDALLAFWIGFLVFENPINYKFSRTFAILLLLLGTLFKYKNITGISYLFLYVSVYLILQFVHHNRGKETVISKLGAHTLEIYIIHVFIIKITRMIWKILDIDYYKYWYIDFSLIIIISFVLSPILYNFFKSLYNNFCSYIERKEIKK